MAAEALVRSVTLMPGPNGGQLLVYAVETQPLSPERKIYLQKAFSTASVKPADLNELKCKVQTLAAERFFIGRLFDLTPLEASLDAIERMRAKGVTLYSGRERRIIFPKVPEDTPWPIICAWCKTQRLAATHQSSPLNDQEYRAYLAKLQDLQKQYPAQENAMEMMFAHVDYLQQRLDYLNKEPELNATLESMKSYAATHKNVFVMPLFMSK